MPSPLRILAGPEARARIAKDGLHEDLFDVVAGASGGPKWLALTRLDRAVFGHWFRTRTRPLSMVGSSIGCWRFACVAQRDPAAACQRFEENYLAYTVEAPVTPAILTRHCREFLEVILEGDAREQILTHPSMRQAILAVRGRGPAGRAHPLAMGTGLAAAAIANAASRRSLPLFFERTLVYDDRSPPPFDLAKGFRTISVKLTAQNMEAALLATAAVPFVFEPVLELHGARPGLYLDGGIMDYHLDIPFQGDGLVLYPHFSDRVIPGWFDKFLKWRKADPRNLSRTVLVCPSAEFIAGLPGGKIPDRADFKRMPTAQRLLAWKRAVAETQRLADIWHEAREKDRLADLVEPLC
ncbi:patatin-like phospholipase family protein [Indioceanicola profundi]|uniref:patatin-like phospholipase family protein n=1 Tax=Indioceanicola profundi TaxID=2220096 RepID=UPI0013C4617E|nr:patatin-like phospholipase family protein [Indioceanicola profundi]